jgi:hypothetical protein
MRASPLPLLFALAFASCNHLEPLPAPPQPPPLVLDDGGSRTGGALGPSGAEDSRDDAAIALAAQAYLDLVVQIHPERATSLGVHAHDKELDGYSPEAEEAGLAQQDAMLADLRSRFASPHASRVAQTDLALIESALAVEARVRRETRPLERRPDAYCGPMDALFLMAARDYAPAGERAGNALARIEKLPAILQLARKNLRKPPRVWVQVAVEQARSADAFFEQQRAFLRGALPSDRARVDTDVAAAKRAYSEYAQFLAHDLMPRAGDDFAAGRPSSTFSCTRASSSTKTPTASTSSARASSSGRAPKWTPWPGASTRARVRGRR